MVVGQPDSSLGEVRLSSPSFLPDGHRYVYVARMSDGTATISLASLDPDVPPRQLMTSLHEWTRVEYVEPGILFYLDRSQLLGCTRATQLDRFLVPPYR